MKGIRLRKNKNSTKTINRYNVFLEGVDTGFLGKEYYTKRKETKYYPFKKSGDDRIVPKYDRIKCISFPDSKKPATGVSINESSGFGFTKPKGVSGIFYYLQNKSPGITEVVFLDKGKTELKGSKLYLNIKDFNRLERDTSWLKDKTKKETEYSYQTILSKVLPAKFKKPNKTTYTKDSLSKFLESKSNIDLSDDDKKQVENLFFVSGITKDTLLKTRKELNIVYIEDVIDEYIEILSLKTKVAGLEERWHQFFKKNSWIFSQIFSFPAVILKDKLNVGGHSIDDDSDRIVDFLYKNNITNNVAFIEIKTHLSQIVNNTPYRKPHIYSIHSELTGGLIQVLDQKDTLLKQSKILGTTAQSFNSVCLLICGHNSMLNNKSKKASFEHFRWSNKDVIILPFDEVLEKLEMMLSLIKKDDKKKKKASK